MATLCVAAPSGRLIKEEYTHDCVQMDVPPGLPPQSDHQGAMKLPAPEHYPPPLPPLQMPPEAARCPPPANLYPNMPLSPTGKIFSVEQGLYNWISEQWKKNWF